jgi:hypothetical protein
MKGVKITRRAAWLDDPFGMRFINHPSFTHLSPAPPSLYRQILTEGVKNYLIRKGRDQKTDPKSWWLCVAIFVEKPNGWLVVTEFDLEAETTGAFYTTTGGTSEQASERRAAWLISRIAHHTGYL